MQLASGYHSIQCSEAKMRHDIVPNSLMLKASHTSHGSSLRWALATFLLATALSACGGSSPASPAAGSGTPSASAAAHPTAAATPGCPTAATVGSALGITLPAPFTVGGGGGGTQLPAGATGIACDYRGQTLNVIIELIRNIKPSYITQFSSKFPVAFTSVSGLGNQARAFSAPLAGGKDNEGVTATQGSTLVSIVATDTPASLSQIESLVRQLL
jgi:hypothetical protein